MGTKVLLPRVLIKKYCPEKSLKIHFRIGVRLKVAIQGRIYAVGRE